MTSRYVKSNINSTGQKFRSSNDDFFTHELGRPIDEEATPGAIEIGHRSSWVQSYLFTEWFNHFTEHTKPTSESSDLLLLDENFSHTRNLDVIVEAKDNHVTIVCLSQLIDFSL